MVARASAWAVDLILEVVVIKHIMILEPKRLKIVVAVAGISAAIFALYRLWKHLETPPPAHRPKPQPPPPEEQSEKDEKEEDEG